MFQRVKGEELLPQEKDNPRNCLAAQAECQFAAGDVRNVRSSEQGESLYSMCCMIYN